MEERRLAGQARAENYAEAVAVIWHVDEVMRRRRRADYQNYPEAGMVVRWQLSYSEQNDNYSVELFGLRVAQLVLQLRGAARYRA